jgi:hypothetical protein
MQKQLAKIVAKINNRTHKVLGCLTPYEVFSPKISASKKFRRIINDTMIAKSQRASHPFYCAIPPLFVVSDGTVTPVFIWYGFFILSASKRDVWLCACFKFSLEGRLVETGAAD